MPNETIWLLNNVGASVSRSWSVKYCSIWLCCCLAAVADAIKHVLTKRTKGRGAEGGVGVVLIARDPEE